MLSQGDLIEFAEQMTQNKPHLIVLENKVQELRYGTLTVEMVIKDGKVDKMDFVEKKSWIRKFSQGNEPTTAGNKNTVDLGMDPRKRSELIMHFVSGVEIY